MTLRGLAVSHSVQEGTSALMSAAAHGHIDVVDALMAAGAAVNGTNKAGTTALMMASEWGHTAMIEKLVAVGAQINARTQVRACGKGRKWHYAYSTKRVCGCSCPLSSHARVATRAQTGRSALAFSSSRGWVDAVRALLRLGADVDAADNFGNTAVSGGLQ